MSGTDVGFLVVILLASITGGGLVAVAAALFPAMEDLPHPAAVRLHQVFDPHIHRYMPMVTGASALGAIILLVTHDAWPPPCTLLVSLGLGGSIVTMLISQFLNVPINHEVLRWTAETIPVGYPSIRRRWGWYNLVRTITALGALACHVAASLLR